MLIAALFAIARTCASRGAMVPASVWCLGVSQFWGVLFSSPTSSWVPGGDRLCLSVISGEPGPGHVVMNACWKNVQTQSNWPTVFKRVTWSLSLVGRVKWWWSVCPGVGTEPQACTVQCLHVRTWIRALDVDASFKTSFLLSFSGRKFPGFW